MVFAPTAPAEKSAYILSDAHPFALHVDLPPCLLPCVQSMPMLLLAARVCPPGTAFPGYLAGYLADTAFQINAGRYIFD